ncbi:MAG: DUF4974 domain-containing protein [Carboxylicivirga sp.]|jgi:ferric-dicitrate binding protein FerR (iron transport regulator)|nr:DUF4974 domain-containing protein [Carboxylicivirga sp.]
MNKDLLYKYLHNTCSEKEFEEVATCITEMRNEKELKLCKEYWDRISPVSITKNEEKYSALLDKIHHEINLKPAIGTQGITIRKVTNWLSRAAAILFIPLLGVLLYLSSNNNLLHNIHANYTVDSLEIITPIGSRSVVQLSDGTKVYLNHSSKIKYPKVFTGDSREITLEGEGYFDVAHNPDLPFIVKTGKLNVKALGTEFNVRAYLDDDIIATTLVEGKVVVEKNESRMNIEPLGIMVPGQHISYNLNSGEVISTRVEVDKYISWKNGRLVFDNETLEEVAERLGRIYNVDFYIADEIKDYRYTVTLDDTPLFLILELMTEITDINYTVHPRKKLPNGEFSKQKIQIEKQ